MRLVRPELLLGKEEAPVLRAHLRANHQVALLRRRVKHRCILPEVPLKRILIVEIDVFFELLFDVLAGGLVHVIRIQLLQHILLVGAQNLTYDLVIFERLETFQRSRQEHHLDGTRPASGEHALRKSIGVVEEVFVPHVTLAGGHKQ